MEEYLEDYRDLFNLFSRIKEIDESYQLMINKKTKRIEVHNFSQRGSSFVMVAEPLDARLIQKLVATRRENAKAFFKKLDDENEELERKNIEKIATKASLVSEEIAKYSFSKNRDLTDDEFKKILNI